MTADRLDTRNDLAQISGWFQVSDQELFRFFLQRQADRAEGGDLVELGCYLGKSAVLMGEYLAPGESFTVVDLFGNQSDDAANSRENHDSYASLTREAFEANYLRFHPDLPHIHTALSSSVTDLVEPGAARFVHVDASHLYEHVAVDIDSARGLLGSEGIVSFDDYRAEHTPGVAAAVWEAVLTKGLHPVAVTPSKLYGTWGDPDAVREDLVAHLATVEGTVTDVQDVAGHRLVRCKFPAGAGASRGVHRDRPKRDRKGGEIARLRGQVEDLEHEVRALRGSASFRLGRALTAPARAARRR